MPKSNIFLTFTCILVVLISSQVYSKRIKDKIYRKIDAASACFRRLNGTHQIGCTSKEKGNIGVIHLINSDADLDYILQDGPNHPYAALIQSQQFTSERMMKIKGSDRVNGVVIMNYVPDMFSPDNKCPLDDYGLYKNTELAGCPAVEWNGAGEGLMFQDFNFPIFIISNTSDIEFIKQCYEKHNNPANTTVTDTRLCAIQLKDRMDGAKDSETCVRRTRHQLNLNPDRYCDPLGDMNVYATLKAVNSSEDYPNDSVVVAAARLDSFSMFEDQYPSADSVVTGIVALLAAAEVVGKFREEFTSSPDYKDLAFMFFQGEAFDYIGSGRMVYDMNQDQFPLHFDGKTTLHQLRLEHVDSFVEVSQLGFRDQGSLWLHTDPLSNSNATVKAKVRKMLDSLQEIGQSVNSPVSVADEKLPLPPASVQSFLKERLDIPAVVITDHQGAYTNRYYNSRFDLAQFIGVDGNATADYNETDQAANLTSAATLLAQFLYTSVTGKNASKDMVADNRTVTNLLNCFLVSPKCDLFQSVLTKENADVLDDKPYNFYVGVDWQTNHVTSLTQFLLARYLGENATEIENMTVGNCSQPSTSLVYKYYWMQGETIDGNRTGSCIRSTANTSLAKSIAFDTDDWTSGKYSTWTESAWANNAIEVQVFLIPSKRMETVTLSLGVVMFLVSLLLVWFVDSKVDILFAHPGPSRDYL